jgi:hypothetical protein
MQVRVHGNALGNVRNDFVFGQKPDDSPEVKLMWARAKVADLERKHAEAQSTFRSAIDDDNGHHDLQALKSNVARLARELEAATEEERMLDNLATQRKLDRLPKLIAETRAQREEFIRLYRATCAALGKYCGSVGELMELVNLDTRLHATALHYSPHKNEALELATLPRPLEGFAYTPVTHIGYDWALKIVPIQANENGGR